MKTNSVVVRVNDNVKAGTQLGLAASSGRSDWPHLHFESRFNNTWYEPYLGTCRTGQSYWENQVPILREFSVNDFIITNMHFSVTPAPPADLTRVGSFVRGNRIVGFRVAFHNVPANSNWRVRFLSPNGLPLINDTGFFGNNPFYRYAWGSWSYENNFNILGTWQIELSFNDQVMARAPFDIVNTANLIVNRQPNPVEVIFDPPHPSADQVVFCRVQTQILFNDPDYDVVRYHYVWKRNGSIIRDVTSAAESDAIPRESTMPGDLLCCEVTPGDGIAEAQTSSVCVSVGGFPSEKHSAITIY